NVCVDNSDCGGGTCRPAGTCEFFFGAPFPLSAGGVSICEVHQVAGTVSGHVDVESGAFDAVIPVIENVYGGATNAEPCPRCVGDDVTNDGIRNGICSGGLRAGLPCDRNGTHPNAHHGSTSLDCPSSTSLLAISHG